MQFKGGDLVLIRLHPERFSPGIYGKLHARRVVYIFKVLKQFSTNFYLIDLPSELADLTTYHGPLPSVKSTAPTNSPHVQPITEVEDFILTHQFVFLKL
jgi:hypothetical protein